MAAQAKDGQRIMPKAVLGTIAGVTVLSSLASLALVGCLDYNHISSASGFASAFAAAGYVSIYATSQ
jgi:amino acid transporter